MERGGGSIWCGVWGIVEDWLGSEGRLRSGLLELGFGCCEAMLEGCRSVRLLLRDEAVVFEISDDSAESSGALVEIRSFL